jgi:hypothetical protein
VQGNCMRQCRSAAMDDEARRPVPDNKRAPGCWSAWPITHTTAWSSSYNIRVNPARAGVVIQKKVYRVPPWIVGARHPCELRLRREGDGGRSTDVAVRAVARDGWGLATVPTG